MAKPTLEDVMRELVAIHARLDALTDRKLRGENNPRRIPHERQDQDETTLDKPQTVMRSPIERVRTRGGKVVSRVKQPR